MSKAYAANVQANSAKKSHQRHLDHLIDIQEGNPFTVVHRQLGDAMLDGVITATHFKLIFCLMSHSGNFRIKRAYLENRFSKASLAKYLGKMEEDGWIRRERVPLARGGYEVVYHTNRLAEWRYEPSQVDDRSLIDGRLENPLNETNLNEEESLSSKESEIRVSEEQKPSAQEEKEAKKAEDSLESEKTEDTSPEHIAAEEISKELAEHGLKAKPLDVKKCLEFGCEFNSCKLEDVLKQRKAAISHITAQGREKGPVWYLRNWLMYELPKIRAQEKVKTNDAPKITPRQIGQVSQQMSQADPRPKHIFSEDLLTPEELAEEERQRKEELKIKIAAAKKKLGIKSHA